MKKTKIFLGGFINYTNAQNLNCLALANHLNKDKFKVYTLEYYAGNLESNKGKITGVKIFNCFKPARISIYLGFLWGIWHCDIAYLPKGELWKYNRFLLGFFKKKSFTTIESIIDETVKDNAITNFGSFANYIKSRLFFNNQYSITSFMKKYNEENVDLRTADSILNFGINADDFKTGILRIKLKNVLLIGNDLIRKGIYDYFKIASFYPEINFYIAGSGNGKIDVLAEIDRLMLKNVIYKGSVTPLELKELLKEIDLHILPSCSEGFPKVTLETAAAGVPSIVYDDYGAEEWIRNGINGWVVKDLNEMIKVIETIKNDETILNKVSMETVQLAKSFDWKVKVKDWENAIEETFRS